MKEGVEKDQIVTFLLSRGFKKENEWQNYFDLRKDNIVFYFGPDGLGTATIKDTILFNGYQIKDFDLFKIIVENNSIISSLLE